MRWEMRSVCFVQVFIGLWVRILFWCLNSKRSGNAVLSFCIKISRFVNLLQILPHRIFLTFYNHQLLGMLSFLYRGYGFKKYFRYLKYFFSACFFGDISKTLYMCFSLFPLISPPLLNKLMLLAFCQRMAVENISRTQRNRWQLNFYFPYILNFKK